MRLGKSLFHLALLLVMLAAVAFGASLLPPPPYSEAKTIGEGVAGFKELSDRFVALTKEKGAVYAFEVLKRAKLPPNTDIHFLGHAIGDELYKQKGVYGILDCTEDFRNACSHSITVSAFVEFGSSALPMIRGACKRAPGGSGAYTMCYHGLGHGVFAYFGYSLPETVAECKKTGTEEYQYEEYSQCVGGTIMELVGGGAHDPELIKIARQKYFSPADPLAPCTNDVIPEETKVLCFLYLTPHLWEVAGIDIGHPNSGQFPDAFKFCDAIPSERQKMRDACFGSFGKEFVILPGARDFRRIEDFTDEEFALGASWCELAGPMDGRDACIGEAVASVFWGGENDPRAAFRFCSVVSGDEMSGACFKRLADDIAKYILNPVDRKRLCMMMPEEFQSSCKEKSI